MRVGIAGLDALYWPVAMAKGLRAKGVELAAAATLGVDEAAIGASLGLSPSEYAARYGLRLYEQAEEMIAHEGLDTVILVTRHSQHAAWAERLAALGVDLYIPKTFATTLEDAERIVAAQRRYGVRIAVGPTARYLPAMMAVKEALDQGLIGRPFALRLCHHHGTIDVFSQSDWYRDPQEGGPELSLGWYGIDLILHFMADGVRSVCADYGNYTSPGSPFMDCGRMVLRLAGGGVASFDMYFCNRVPYPSWQLEVVGPQGVISIHRTERDPLQTVVSLDSAEGYRALPLPERTPNWETYWVEDFQAGREPAVTPEAARLITEISLAAREAASTGAPVLL
jgi:predicted dehydrogenase